MVAKESSSDFSTKLLQQTYGNLALAGRRLSRAHTVAQSQNILSRAGVHKGITVSKLNQDICLLPRIHYEKCLLHIYPIHHIIYFYSFIPKLEKQYILHIALKFNLTVNFNGQI